MINRSDVITIRVPFPNINSKLAVESHMYICHKASEKQHNFVKCQTLKPYMLISSPMKHYWDEAPDIKRNPFVRTTRIDCDKDFVTVGVEYDDCLKAKRRPDVCSDTMSHIDQALKQDGYKSNHVSGTDLVKLNQSYIRVK